MDDEFIFSRFRWTFFLNLELDSEIDEQFENAEVQGGLTITTNDFGPSGVIPVIPGVFAEFWVEWCYNGHSGRRFSDRVV